MKTGLRLDTTQWDNYIKRVRDKVDKDLEMLVRQTTTNISSKAKMFAPVDTGRLKTSIRSRYEKKDGEVKAEADYGAYVEFGTGSGFKAPAELIKYARDFRGKRIRKVNNRAQPFLYPGFFIERAKFYEKLKNLIGRAK